MAGSRSSLIACLISVFAMTVGAHEIRACAIVFSPADAPPSFTVVLRDRGQPLPNMKVFLEPATSDGFPLVVSEKDPLLAQITDANGYAHFDKIPEGYFYVRSELPNGSSKDIHVVPSLGDPKYAIWLDCPAIKVVTAARLSGNIRSICDKGDCPLSTNLSLVDAITARQLGSASIQGNFDFGHVPDGLYFLKIRPGKRDPYGWTPEGDVAVEIRQDAPNRRISLDVGMSSCGMYYAGNCTAEPIFSGGVCGFVTDPMGAAIEASVQVRDQKGRLVSSGKADRSGFFDLSSEIRQGDYELDLFATGFTPFRASLQIESASQCQPFHVELGVLGSCSRTEGIKTEIHAQTN